MDQVTSAADVYGLGATLYELLTGRPPFVGSTAVETMWMAIHQSPVPPRQVNPVVPRDLETIALRCLEKSPERRYPSAAAVAEELDRFARREPIRARPVSSVEQVWRWCQRRPGLALMVCALLVTILAGSGAAVWQWRRAERANLILTESNSHLEWESIDTMVNQGQGARALARVAAQLRKDPQDWQAAMFGMSLMNERRFPIPAAPPIRHPDGAELAVARLSPDGRRLVTASSDGTARLWDAATSQPVGPPLAHQAPVTWAEFSPDGRLVATCSEDKSVRLWEVATGQAVGASRPHDEGVVRIQFSPDGKYLLTRTPRTVSFLDGHDARPLIGPLSHDGPVVAARFVSAGRAFFTAHQAGDNSRIRVWDLPAGQEQAGLLTGPLRDADLNEDLTRVVVAGRDGHAWVADFPSGEHRAEIVSRNGAIQNVAFSVHGDCIASLGVNHWARVWDSRTALPITGELPHYHALAGMAFLPDGGRLLTWANDSLAQVWNIPEGKPYCEPLRHADRVLRAEYRQRGQSELVLTTLSLRDSGSSRLHTGAAQMWEVAEAPHQGDVEFGIVPGGIHTSTVSADGRRIAIGRVDGVVAVHDRLTGAAVCGPLHVNGKGGAPKLLFSPDASRMLTTTAQGEVSVWSIPEGRRLADPVKLSAPLEPAATTADGRYFATVASDGMVRLWDSASGRSSQEMRHGSGLNAVAFSPEGRFLASAGTDRVVRLWETATGKLASELQGHQNEVLAVFFSPDGRKLVTASLDFTTRIWNAADGRELSVLAHGGEVLDACFSPDGRFVASASRDRTAMIWNVETGRPHTRELAHEQSVINVRFSPDSSQLLTVDYHGLRLWDVATGRPLTVRLAEQFQLGTGFQADSGRPIFTPDGLAVFLAGDSYVSRILHISTPSAGAPAWFAKFLEGVAGQRFEPGADLPAVVPPTSFLGLRQRVLDSADTDYYTRWVRQWLDARNAVRGVP
jgi:WD40 repeat protein